MATGVASWSTTASSNASADSAVNWAEGQAPSTVNDSGRGMMSSVAKFRDDLSGALTTGGTSTAYTVTSNQVFASLTVLGNRILTIIPHATSGAAPTLAVDGLTAKAINIATAVAVPTGYLIQGTPYIVYYGASVGEFIVLGTPAIFSGAVAGTTGTFSSTFNATGAATFGSTVAITGVLTQSATSHGILAIGTTGQRSGSPTAGMYRYNSTRSAAEFYNGANWVAMGIGATSQAFTSGSSATYTTPASCTLLKIRMIGGGGGGGGIGTSGGGTGGTGGTTSFNSITVIGGTGGSANNGSSSGSAGGAGGTGGSGSVSFRRNGTVGGAGCDAIGGTTFGAFSGAGAASFFAGGAPSVTAAGAGLSPSANSGAGASGAYKGGATIGQAGGGGAGEYAEFFIIAPSATYTYSVGAAGTAGTAGTGGSAGGAGAAGFIVVEEWYG